MRGSELAHPLHHAISSAKRFGGIPDDYQPIHVWFDASKEHMAYFTHRALRHAPKAFSKPSACSARP